MPPPRMPSRFTLFITSLMPVSHRVNREWLLDDSWLVECLGLGQCLALLEQPGILVSEISISIHQAIIAGLSYDYQPHSY